MRRDPYASFDWQDWKLHVREKPKPEQAPARETDHVEKQACLTARTATYEEQLKSVVLRPDGNVAIQQFRFELKVAEDIRRNPGLADVLPRDLAARAQQWNQIQDLTIGASMGMSHATLFRGVPSGTARGNLALKGIVRPRGTSTDYLTHVKGGDVAADVTSWTRDPAAARRFGDIVLKVDESAVRSRIVPHPAPGLHPDEQEVLIRGLLENVQHSP